MSYQQHDPSATARAADETTQMPTFTAHAAPRPQPDNDTPRPASNGWTAEERAERRAKQGSIGNWFQTGDKHTDPKSTALAPAEYDGFSIAGLILAFFVPIAGLILSIVSFAEAKKNHRRTHWTGITGFIVGALGCVAWTLYWVVVIAALIFVTSAATTYPTGG
jgi:hypothetical protein